MKYIILLQLIIMFMACHNNTPEMKKTENKATCFICAKAEDWRFYEDDPLRHKYSFGFKVDENKFIIDNDSAGHTLSFRFDNDRMVGSSDKFEDEMFNSRKGLYFFGSGEIKTIAYADRDGPGFNIQYNPAKKVIEKFQWKDNEILLDRLDTHKSLIIIRRDINGKVDSTIYIPKK